MKGLLSILFLFFLVNCSAQSRYEKTTVDGKETWVLHYQKEKKVNQFTDPIQRFMDGMKSEKKFINDKWERLYPDITDAYIQSIETSGDTVIAAGNEGDFYNPIPVILLSTNKGKDWKKITQSESYFITEISLKDNVLYGLSFKYEFGYTGRLSKSTDLGKTWILLKEENDSPLIMMNISGENIIISSYHLFLSQPGTIDFIYSTNRGITWDRNSFPVNPLIADVKVSFSDSVNGWIAFIDNSYTKIFHTTNKGVAWTEQLSQPVSPFWIKQLITCDNKTVYFINYDDSDIATFYLYKSSDSGNSWINMKQWSGDYYTHALISSLDGNKLSVSLFERNENTISVDNETTSDGGITWTSYTNEIPDDLFYCLKYTGTGCWIGGEIGSIFYKEGDGPWESKMNKISSYSLWGISYVDTSNAFACDNGGHIFKSTDGRNFLNVYNDYSTTFYDIIATNTDNIFAAGLHNNFSSQILRSTNSGASWTKYEFDSLMTKKIYFKDTDNGWVTAACNFYSGYKFPTLLKTTDGGSSWKKVYCTSLITGISDINNILFTNDNQGWLIGMSGVIMRTSDNGDNWNLAWGNLDPNEFWVHTDLYGIYAFNENEIFVCGVLHEGMSTSDILLKTTNKGETWVMKKLGVRNSFGYDKINIYFRNKTDGWIFGPDIYITSDGGWNWSKLASPHNIQAYAVVNNSFWVSGNGGSLYKNSALVAGIKEISSPVPQAFNLHQNYPNPFNPSTTIEYDLPDVSNVEIKVYDVLGNETAVLVNEIKKQGRHSVTFNASNLASGIYIYRIKTNTYTASKKMIYLK